MRPRVARDEARKEIRQLHAVHEGDSMRETRDWDARDYVAHSAAQQVWARELIEKLRLRGDEAVLDIGCGDGRATAMIAERLPEGSVLGVDDVAEHDRAGQRAVPAGRPSQHELPADGRQAPRAAARLRRRLLDRRAALGGRPRGGAGWRAPQPAAQAAASSSRWAAAATWPRRTRWARRSSPVRAGAPTSPAFRRPTTSTPPTTTRCGCRAPASASRARTSSRKDMPHAGRDAFLGWLRTTWFAYTDRLPTELREELLRRGGRRLHRRLPARRRRRDPREDDAPRGGGGRRLNGMGTTPR